MNKNVFYQIYPLGALDAPFENDGRTVSRIKGLESWIAHLKRLDVDWVLLNPVFLSHTHGYDTIDPTTIDNRLGTNEDFIEIVNLYHENGIRVMIDAVFNHVGRGFFAFQDVLKNRYDSRYKDWFEINFEGNNRYDDHLWYRDWEGCDNLVQLNLRNPEVIAYWQNVLSYWKDTFSIDGLRLDVAYRLDPDFIKIISRQAHEMNLFLVGETLHGDYNQWVNKDMLDCCTNYECYKGIYSSFNSANLFEICHSLQRQFGSEPWCLYTGKMLLNFVDNHDVTRISSILNDERHLPLVYGLLMSMPGIPCLYYGSEWGQKGNKNYNDTELRPYLLPEFNDLTLWIQKLIQIKHEHTALQNASFKQIALTNTACIFERTSQEETLWVCINMSEDSCRLQVPTAHLTDIITGGTVEVGHELELMPRSFVIYSK